MRVVLAILVCATINVAATGRLSAMDRWAALSMIESGDDDFVVGKQGEVSRYQIMPSVIAIYDLRLTRLTNAACALRVARVIMQERCSVFAHRHGRGPSDTEWYLLWSCPARVDRPTRLKAETAERFANLCHLTPALSPKGGEGESKPASPIAIAQKGKL